MADVYVRPEADTPPGPFGIGDKVFFQVAPSGVLKPQIEGGRDARYQIGTVVGVRFQPPLFTFRAHANGPLHKLPNELRPEPGWPRPVPTFIHVQPIDTPPARRDRCGPLWDQKRAEALDAGLAVAARKRLRFDGVLRHGRVRDTYVFWVERPADPVAAFFGGDRGGAGR